jgi:hypothetical protein
MMKTIDEYMHECFSLLRCPMLTKLFTARADKFQQLNQQICYHRKLVPEKQSRTPQFFLQTSATASGVDCTSAGGPHATTISLRLL